MVDRRIVDRDKDVEPDGVKGQRRIHEEVVCLCQIRHVYAQETPDNRTIIINDLSVSGRHGGNEKGKGGSGERDATSASGITARTRHYLCVLSLMRQISHGSKQWHAVNE